MRWIQMRFRTFRASGKLDTLALLAIVAGRDLEHLRLALLHEDCQGRSEQRQGQVVELWSNAKGM